MVRLRTIMAITLNYTNETRTKVDKRIFSSLLPKIAKKHPSARNKEVILVLIGDAQIRALNKQCRKKDKPTDVLSFAYEETSKFPGKNPLGEIYISLPTAKRQARKDLNRAAERPAPSLQKKKFSRQRKHLIKELKFLFIHGILHLLGYTHETQKKYERMMEKAEEILA